MFYEKLKHLLLGKARPLNDPSLFHRISLVAFFAWVGLGADGLSSSCYGPESAFLALREHIFLGFFVALATAATIFIISASYSQIVTLFPSGGGGYLVASKLLSPEAGMVSGCALLIDYVLTITLSIASGADALFSILPHGMHQFKLIAAFAGLLLLIFLNLRGVKESVMPLVPIFLLFIVTHLFVIGYTFFTHFADYNAVASNAVADAQRTSAELGIFGMFALVLRSYSMGAGTFTGIEAVSNGVPILREPRVETAKKTMMYMAISLAFMAAGLMIAYLLYRVTPEAGKTLNAVLLERMTAPWGAGGAKTFILVTLASEAVLLFVAAQTGFLDGPRVLANMATDRWFPSQFALLSERLVIKHGILLMGAASMALMLVSRGSVQFLVVLYSINVFITFVLSQLGMVRHWWTVEPKPRQWFVKIGVNALGLILSVFILVSMVVMKFREGGWLTIIITGSLVIVAISIRRFYSGTRKLLARLDTLVHAASLGPAGKAPKVDFDPDSKIAVLLVNGFNGMGLHTLLNALKLFGGSFKNFFFIHAGIIDAERFKGKSELDSLKAHVDEELGKYVAYMKGQGYYAEGFPAIDTDVADAISDVSYRIFERYPQSVFFGGQIIFPEETFLTRLLYNHTVFTVQRRLHQRGIPFLIMPIRVAAAT